MISHDVFFHDYYLFNNICLYKNNLCLIKKKKS